jgi:hypothetical protein
MLEQEEREMNSQRVASRLLFCVGLASVCSAIVSPMARAEEVADKDRPKLQGKWELVAMEVQGAELSLPAERRLTIDGDKATLRIGKQTLVSRWKLDSRKDPKRSTKRFSKGR